MTEPWPHWSDDTWVESDDTVWRRGLRLQQGWWRSTHTMLGPGYIRGRARPVVSMLPDGVGWPPNLMTPEACGAAERALARMKSSAQQGIIAEDRRRRNLLSSQPLCFNLFGYLDSHREAPSMGEVGDAGSVFYYSDRARVLPLLRAPSAAPPSMHSLSTSVETEGSASLGWSASTPRT